MNMWLRIMGIIFIFILFIVYPTYCAINYDPRISPMGYISQIFVSIGITVICGIGLDWWYKSIREKNAKKYNKLFFMELKPVLEDYLNDCLYIYAELTSDEDCGGRFYLPIEPMKFLNVFFVPKLQERWREKDSFLLSGKRKHSLLGGLKISATFLSHGLEGKLTSFMTVLPQKNIDEILNINNSIGARSLQVGVIDLASEGLYYDAKKENIRKEDVNIDDVKEYIEKVAILFEKYNRNFPEQSIKIPGYYLYPGRNGSNRYFESGKYDCSNKKYV